MTLKGTPKPEQVNTFAELLEDRSGTAFFWDQEVGIMFRRFQVDLPRSPEDRTRCVGDHCPEFFIDVEHEGLGDEDGLVGGDTDCRDRAYPKYQLDPL